MTKNGRLLKLWSLQHSNVVPSLWYLRRIWNNAYDSIAHLRIYACLFTGKSFNPSAEAETTVLARSSSVASFAAAGHTSGVVCAPGWNLQAPPLSSLQMAVPFRFWRVSPFLPVHSFVRFACYTISVVLLHQSLLFDAQHPSKCPGKSDLTSFTPRVRQLSTDLWNKT